MIPSGWHAILLALAAWRTFHLLAFDDILQAPRRFLVRLPLDWKEGDSIPKMYREKLKDFIECPFCLGFWIAGAWWLTWYVWPHGTLIASVPFALSAGVVAAQRYLSS
jgi:hypothetical protein